MLIKILQILIYFPESKILLCTFHVIKWFKTLINKKEILDGAKIVKKQEILEILSAMIYSKNIDLKIEGTPSVFHGFIVSILE